MSREIIPAEHIGDGLYLTDIGYAIEIAVNHHNNTVATIDINDIDRAIEYLQKVQEKLLKK